MRVLIIEDEILIQKSLKKLLEREAVYVHTASSGKEALELLTQHDYDRIVCDLMLQDITGFDVIEESKRKYTTLELSQKFIIVTAYSSDLVLDRAKEYGCPILSKPFANMQTAIQVILNQTRGQSLEQL